MTLKNNKKEKELIKHIDALLKDIETNAIADEHRNADINPDCAECKFRILEGFLSWYKDLLK